jgi:Dyp-type peroxidase family
MPYETTPQRLQAAPALVPSAPALDLDQIQGDVLIGLQKNFERFIFFEIKDVQGFKRELRNSIASRITTTGKVLAQELELKRRKEQGDNSLIHLVGLNVGFTHNGMQKLAPGEDLKDPSFNTGAKNQANVLGDPFDDANPQKPPITWLPEFLSDAIDGVFLVTGESENSVNDEARHVLSSLGSAIAVIYDETGHVRPGLARGHEHFGWLDGVSNPGVKGLTDPFPGQRLIDAGAFVFGYPQPSPTAHRPPQPSPDGLAKNGSFMVFRRLKQLVPEFTQFILMEAASVQGTDPNKNVVTTGMDPVLLGARMVGRWKSGAPLALTPSQDDTTLGKDPTQNNNFDFSDDQTERRCPFGAHIRKVNPRQDFAPQTNPNDPTVQDTAVDPRRIMRQGIPFGPEVSAAEQSQMKTLEDRGLMFVCYQTSIPFQFEFLQHTWADNPNFISPGAVQKVHADGSTVTVGFDPIIGQNTPQNPPSPQPPDPQAGQPQPRTADEPIPNYPTGDVRSTLTIPQPFIVPTGGEYFFVPSISALKHELSA